MKRHGRFEEFVKPVLREYFSPAETACREGSGPVVASFPIDKKGKPRPADILEEHGEGAGGAVASAISAWRFHPGLLDGKPAEATAMVEMECRATSVNGFKDEVGGAFRLDQSNKDMSPPVPVYKIEPEYSEAARRAKYQGTVVLGVLVDSSGHVASARVLRPLGLGLDEKAVEAVVQWRLKPAIRNGLPVAMSATIEVNFRLL